MEIFKEDNVEIVVFEGFKYKRYPKSNIRTDRTYFKRYVKDGKNSYLHRDVYRKYVGDIPEGYDIHHLDGNTDNNDISNLSCVERWKHSSDHKKEFAKKNRQMLLDNLERGRPKTREWMSTEAGKEHFREMGRQSFLKRQPRKNVCKHCGKEYISKGTKLVYCSKKCSSVDLSRIRRAKGKDKEERVCTVCGKTFMGNKYNKPKGCSAKCRAILRYGKQE